MQSDYRLIMPLSYRVVIPAGSAERDAPSAGNFPTLSPRLVAEWTLGVSALRNVLRRPGLRTTSASIIAPR
jgi:hypothetical protein